MNLKILLCLVRKIFSSVHLVQNGHYRSAFCYFCCRFVRFMRFSSVPFLCNCRWQTASSRRGSPGGMRWIEMEWDGAEWSWWTGVRLGAATNEHARMMEHLNGSDDTWNCFACCSDQRHSSKAEEHIFWRHSSRHSCQASVSAFRMRLL